jgi:hypothetical protein
MKKLITIAFILGVATGYAQDTVHIPTRVAKQIATDLVKYDSLKAVHELTAQQLIHTEEKTVIQDSIITLYKLKATDYDKQISAEERKTGIWQDQYKEVAKKCKKLKTKLVFTRIALSAIIGGITYLYIVK